MSKRLKPTINNIISLWYGEDTPIRQAKIQSNPLLWAACLEVNKDFRLPSGGRAIDARRKSDKVLYVRAVLQYLSPEEGSSTEKT